MGGYLAGNSDDVDCWVGRADIVAGDDKRVEEIKWCSVQEMVELVL